MRCFYSEIISNRDKPALSLITVVVTYFTPDPFCILAGVKRYRLSTQVTTTCDERRWALTFNRGKWAKWTEMVKGFYGLWPRGVIWGDWGSRPQGKRKKEKIKKKRKNRKKEKKRKKERRELSNVKLLHIKCCFFQFFNSLVALKNKK